MSRRPKLKIVAHFAIVEGNKVEIDPAQTNLPDRCKVAIAEITSGYKCEVEELCGS